MSTRIYVITDKTTSHDRLVRAGGPSQALNHVAAHILTGRLASKDDLVQLLTAGVRVEEAGQQAQQELELPPAT